MCSSKWKCKLNRYLKFHAQNDGKIGLGMEFKGWRGVEDGGMEVWMVDLKRFKDDNTDKKDSKDDF